MNRSLIRIAMTTAGIMLAHQVASKAFRDAAFLAAWPVTALPVMIVATSVLILALVPVFSRLLDRFSPLVVVSAGFALSAGGHLAEWFQYHEGRWVVVVIYLHLAGVTALLLSGFWSIIAERFDPASARASYGRIAAAGTAGGVLGSIAAERVASMANPDAMLLLLTALHVMCAIGVLAFRHTPTLLPRDKPERTGSGLQAISRSPYLRTIAATVALTTAGSAILDYLLKSQATAALGTGPNLLRFFALFYGAVQILSFIAQSRAGGLMQRLGIGGTISALPAGVAATTGIALFFQAWPAMIVVRGAESVLRGSLFRSGYELLFVPMDPSVRRRVKTALDVTCDRAGEAMGAGIVQLMLIIGVVAVSRGLLAVVLALAGLSFWLGRRLDQLYLGVVEQQLLKYRDAPLVSVVSEAGWTVLNFPTGAVVQYGSSGPPPAPAPEVSPPHLDAPVHALVDLRSTDPVRVVAALEDVASLSRVHVAQIIDLLAWDEVLVAARKALEMVAPAHLGMLVDALLEPQTDFVIRRRLPRVLGTIASARSLDGVVRGLDDPRFEVRYHCSRAIDRMLTKNPELSVDRARMIAVVERELSVPPQVWQGYRLLERPELDESGAAEPEEVSSRNLNHVFSLLSTIVAREPLDAAVRGIRSTSPGVRGLAIEYLDQVLPAAVLARLRAMIASTPSAGDAPSQSGEPPIPTPPSNGR